MAGAIPGAAPGAGGIQFNKMFVMIPVMLAARKLDGEDPAIVKLLRISYGVMQLVCVVAVLYTYYLARAIATTQYQDRVVYVPPAAAQPFADPNAKKKYTEIAYGQHVLSTARSLVGSTLFGIGLTCALHYYKGMVMGLAIQTVMAPLNLWENALVKAVLQGGSAALKPENTVFDEKLSFAELTDNDEVVDEQGNPVVRAAALTSNSNSKQKTVKKTLEEIMLDTWDQGAKADLTELLAALTKSNVNTQTTADKWTALHILAGLNCPGAVAAIRTVVNDLQADISQKDKDGWNCMHWAAFHGSLTAATELLSNTALLTVKDKEGKTPAETALQEGNTAVAELLEASANETKKGK